MDFGGNCPNTSRKAGKEITKDKIKPKQIAWKMLSEMNQFKVPVVRSMSEFMEIVNER